MSAAKQLEDALFFAALHITDPKQRRLFLDQACLDDSALRESVEQMLAIHEDADRLIDRGRDAIARAATEIRDFSEAADLREQPDQQIGKRIGRYTILESLGEGGCGSVYLAEQNEPVTRRVALKVIKLGMDTRRVIARFNAERQALAMMDHPNIARVLDAGATEAGRPYFVLELVRGIRITEFCDTNRCDLRQRLELFIQVCNAIQHAHQKGIIHRDIKPSNVLVAMHDGIPMPKVIDFGIAKAIEGHPVDETLHTLNEQLLGTPAYMSPEQAQPGRFDVDTRSDVYSLGILLYELLTGRTPFDAGAGSKAESEETRRILREREPQRPSALLASLDAETLKTVAEERRTEPARLISQVKGDLDWIVVKSLQKERARRYDTANGLMMDVRRFLRNEPILARPPGRLYLLGKLIRRHAGLFAAGAMVMLALTGGLGASTWLYFKAKRAEMRQSELRQVAEHSLANEEVLRKEAESREKLTEVVILLRQRDYAGAAKALGSMENRPRQPSLDGITALRSVGEWLALQERWQEASECFLWLLQINELESSGQVTFDTQACGVVLVESGDAARYRKFCEEMAAAYASSTNGGDVVRILKTCLLLPSDPALYARLEPIAKTSEAWYAKLPDPQKTGWSLIPLSLWHYRKGEDSRVIELARPLAESPVAMDAQIPTIQAIFAMSLWRQGQTDEARVILNRAREGVDRHFAVPMRMGDRSRGLWYDWLFARILMREAAGLIGKAP
ncbi:MAG TPA: serine/threonine-protein kinase [Luteolibacter sp.]